MGPAVAVKQAFIPLPGLDPLIPPTRILAACVSSLMCIREVQRPTRHVYRTRWKPTWDTCGSRRQIEPATWQMCGRFRFLAFSGWWSTNRLSARPGRAPHGGMPLQGKTFALAKASG